MNRTAKRLWLAGLLATGLLSSGAAQTSKPASAPASQPAESEPVVESQPAESESVRRPTSRPAASESGLVQAIEAAHNKDAWYAQPGVRTNIVVEFGGRTSVEGTLTMAPNGGVARIDRAAGGAVIFDGETAWITPADAEFPGARFHSLTWSYFLAAPYKLSDPGANVAETGARKMSGQEYDTAKLTFDAETGDAPDDWYFLYADSGSGLLGSMAYIVTFGKDAAEAEQEPHAIVYGDYQDVEGIPVPMKWTFHSWNEAQGIHGDPIGVVTLDGFEFAAPPAGAFDKPEDAREEKLPE